VNVREQGNKAQDCNDLELELVAAVGHALGQAVQPKEQDAERHDRNQEKHGRDDHENVSLAGRRNEDRQMMVCNRVNFGSHGPVLRTKS
jgi:hypothetical protein